MAEPPPPSTTLTPTKCADSIPLRDTHTSQQGSLRGLQDGSTATQSLRAFVGACRGEAVFHGADGEAGARTVEAIDLMYKASQSGEVARA